MEQQPASSTPFLGALLGRSKPNPAGLDEESERVACRTIDASIEREEQLSMFEGLEDRVGDKAETCLKRCHINETVCFSIKWGTFVSINTCSKKDSKITSCVPPKSTPNQTKRLLKHRFFKRFPNPRDEDLFCLHVACVRPGTHLGSLSAVASGAPAWHS